MTTHFLLSATVPDWCPCFCATVGLSPEAVERLLKLRGLWEKVKGLDDQFVELYLWDGGYVTFHGNDEDEATPTEEEASALHDTIYQRFGGFQKVPDVLKLAGDDVKVVDMPVYQTECDQMIIGEEGVSWMAYPKHGEGEIRTVKIPWTTIEELTP